MRTIKFRGKARRDGKWYYGNLYVKDTRGRTHICTPERGCFDIDPGTVGQFIGLYNKDGKEIYEGDILNINGSIFEVRFSCGVFGFIPHGSIDDEMSNCLRKGFASVIGNIHDNPDILKGGEK